MIGGRTGRVVLGIFSVLLALGGGLIAAGGVSATITPEAQWAPRELPKGAYYDGLVAGEDGVAYMFVPGQDRVVKFNPDGNRAGGWDLTGRLPTAMAIDLDGNVLVAGEKGIARYTPDGKPLESWPVKHRGRSVSDDIFAMDVAPDGTVYGVDFTGAQILRISASGRYLGSFGSWGTAHGEFLLPEDVAVGPDGRVYVIEGVSTRVQAFGPKGKFLKQWGREGTGPGEFWETSSLDVDVDGRVIVADGYLSRVQIFDADGRYLDQIGSQGGGPGRFRYPSMVAASSGAFIVADGLASRIQKLAYTEGPHLPQAQIEFSVDRWPVESTPGQRVRLPITIGSFGDLAAEDLKICPVRGNRESRNILRGVRCRVIGSLAPGERKKIGFWAKMPAGLKHGTFRQVRFSLRSPNAGGGPIGVTIYAGRDFSWDMD